MKKIELEESRKIQLDILIAISKICDDNNLNYSLAYGTLIGAVRHKGYIPWDDDIDIMLPRKDYDILLSILQNDNQYPNLSLVSYSTDWTYGNYYAKLYDNRTTLVGPMYNYGIFIDIFPIDYLPDEPTETAEFALNCRKTKKLLEHSTKWYKIQTTSIKSRLKNLIKSVVFSPLFFPSRDKTIKLYESLIYKYNNTNTLGLIGGPNGIAAKFNKEMFSEYIDIPFENNLFKSVKDYDTYLTSIYGDYMQLPPENQRVLAHDYDAFWK